MTNASISARSGSRRLAAVNVAAVDLVAGPPTRSHIKVYSKIVGNEAHSDKDFQTSVPSKQ
jgi:hypothetical protein